MVPGWHDFRMHVPLDLKSSDFARIRPRQFAWLGLACVAGTAFAATRPAASPNLHGQLTIVGSRGMAEVLERWARIFHRVHPGVRVMLMPIGSGVAAGALADGDADLAALTRGLRRPEQLLVGRRDVRCVLVGVAPASHQPMYLYIDRLEGGRPAAAAEFVRIALSRESQARIGRDPPVSDPS